MKFSVGDIWESRNKILFIIEEIDNTTYSVKANFLLDRPNTLDTLDTLTLTKDGYEINNKIESEYDLVSYIGNKSTHPEYFL